MSDSPRPVHTMAARTELRLTPLAGKPRRLTPTAGVLPLAAAALLVLPAQAAHRAPARNAPAAQKHEHAHAGKAPAFHTVAGRAPQRAVHISRTHREAPTPIQAKLHGRRRAAPQARSNTAALTTLHDRAARYTQTHAAPRDTISRTYPVSVKQPGPQTHNLTADTTVAVARADAADTAGTADRVHAWYRANASAGADSVGTAARMVPDGAKPVAKEARRSTEADDTAAAQSRIPSTAPTEREPAPFTHGSFSNDGTTAPGPTIPSGHAALPAAPTLLRDGSTPFTPSRNPVTVSAVVPAIRLTPAPGTGRTVNDDGLPSAAVSAPPVNLFDGQGRLIPIAAMKGSHDILVHQNRMAVTDGLDRIQNDADLLRLRRQNLLIALPDETGAYPDERLPMNRRYARSWTVSFLRDLARAHYTRFGTPLIVTSAVRTVEFQRRLVRTNGNAAPPTGDIASPHLYGQAVDIGKRGMSLTELTWMRAYLTPVENDGKIDVEEEFQQSCFHISVYRSYLGLPSPQTLPPTQQLQRPLLTATATAAVPDLSKPEKKHRRLSAAMLAVGLR